MATRADKTMAINIKNKQLALATTAALLISGCSSNHSTANMPSPSHSDMGQCSGVNSCKGNGSCATANNNCAGQNSCKGQGWLPLTKTDCSARSGSFSKFKKG